MSRDLLATVLAIDVIAYSLEFDETQHTMVGLLNDLLTTELESVSTPVTILPTGDGAFVVFELASVATALEIAVAIADSIERSLLRLPLRMGVHSGVLRVRSGADGNRNFVGSAINVAARIMDLGEEGHILLSARAAEEISGNRMWSARVQRIPESPVRVKHGVMLDVYNYCHEGYGKAHTPSKVSASSEVAASWVGPKPDWRETCRASALLRILDLSFPQLGDPALVDHLIGLARTGEVQIRILLAHPASPATFLRSHSAAYKSFDELQTTLEYIIRICRGMRAELSKHGSAVEHAFDVRLAWQAPTMTAVISEERAFVNLYVDHLSGSRGPYLQIERDRRGHRPSLHGCLVDSFDSLWAQAHSVFASDFNDQGMNVLDSVTAFCGTEARARLSAIPHA